MRSKATLGVWLLVGMWIGCGQHPGMGVGDDHDGALLDAASHESCGNGICEAELGEDAASCVADCGFVDLGARSFGGSYAIRADGTVFYWGAVFFSMGSDDCFEPPDPPSPSPELAGAIAVDGGYNHDCAVMADGRVLCWGENHHGQLGNGTTVDSYQPGVVEGISDAVQIAAGLGHTCVVHATGSASCWGSNNHGQLGLPEDDPEQTTTPVAMPYLEDVVDIDASRSAACAVTGAGEVLCWGTHACVGSAGQFMDCHIPYIMPGLDDAVAVSVGSYFACAVRSAGTVVCWGDRSDDGQLGDGSLGDSATPVTAVGLTDAVSIDSGSDHTCAITSSGEVWCWGSNRDGLLGVNFMGAAPTPTLIASISGAMGRPAASENHTCVAVDDGTIRCWGWNCYGQLGDGTNSLSAEPVIVQGL